MKVNHQDENGKNRQVFSSNNLDACRSIEAVNSLPILKDSIEQVNSSFRYSLVNCPWNELKIKNGTFSYNTTDMSKVQVGPAAFPNGIISTYVRLYNNRDKNIFTFGFAVKFQRYFSWRILPINKWRVISVWWRHWKCIRWRTFESLLSTLK